MTQRPERNQQLEKLLSSLTQEKATALAAQLEHLVLKGEGNQEAETMLAVLRTHLRDQGIPRWPTPQHLFCVAFQDFLVDTRDAKLMGRIARSSIERVWKWLGGPKAMGERHEARIKDITAATLRRDEPAKDRLVLEFQNEAAQIMTATLMAAPAGTPARAKLALELGGEDVIADMAEMALLLEHPAALSEVATLIPRQTRDLSEATLNQVKHAYDRLLETTPALGPYVVLFAMTRLERPWEAMALTRAVSRQSQDTLLSSTDMGAAGELLIADMEALAVQVAAARPDNFDPGLLARQLERLSGASAGMARELGIKRDGKWGARIQRARANAAHAVEALIGKVEQEVMAALPVQRMGAFAKGPRKPDVSRAPEPERTASAVKWVGLLPAVKPSGQGLGFLSALQSTQEAIEGALRVYIEALLGEMRTGGASEKPHAKAYFEVAAQISGVLSGEETANLIRRRAAAAMAA